MLTKAKVTLHKHSAPSFLAVVSRISWQGEVHSACGLDGVGSSMHLRRWQSRGPLSVFVVAAPWLYVDSRKSEITTVWLYRLPALAERVMFGAVLGSAAAARRQAATGVWAP